MTTLTAPLIALFTHTIAAVLFSIAAADMAMCSISYPDTISYALMCLQA
jgi:hypothetical protein